VHFFLLPYLEQDNLYNLGISQGGAWTGNALASGAQKLKVFTSPRDASNPSAPWVESNGGTWGHPNYAANHAIFGVPGSGDTNAKASLTSISDGTSNTLGFAEQYAKCGTGEGDNGPHFNKL